MNGSALTYICNPGRTSGRDLDSDGNGTLNRKERWVYDGREAILEFVDPDGAGSAAMALSKRFLNGPAVDQILAQEDLSKSISAADRVLWHLADSQGTVRDLVDNTGDLVEHYRYDAFGELIEIRDGSNNVVTTAPKTNFLYNGMWRDPATKFYATDTRWYNPRTGSWIHEDWIGFRGGDYNLYRYVGNASTIYIDPSGLEAEAAESGEGASWYDYLFGWNPIGWVPPTTDLRVRRSWQPHHRRCVELLGRSEQPAPLGRHVPLWLRRRGESYFPLCRRGRKRHAEQWRYRRHALRLRPPQPAGEGDAQAEFQRGERSGHYIYLRPVRSADRPGS